MLFSLHIRSVALIKELNIDFSEGLTVFTGETGAGKSIIIDSIALLCGARSDKSIIRTGEDFAEVEGAFGMLSKQVQEDLSLLECAPDEEGNLFLSRRIGTDGRSVSRINGRVVPVGKLREVAAVLIDIHGQQDTTRLSDESIHPALLDMYACVQEEKAEYTKAYSRYTSLKKELSALREALNDAEEKKDFLSFKYKELKRASLKEGEQAELMSKRERLVNREKIVINAAEAHRCLYGMDGSAAELAASGVIALNALKAYVPEAEELASRLESVRLEIEDIADSVAEYTDDPEGNPQAAIDEMESRLSLISTLCRKYRTDEHGLIAMCAETEAELSRMETGSERIDELEKDMVQAEKEAKQKAQLLFAARQKGAKKMEKQIKEILGRLDMPSVTFVTEFAPTPLTPHGCESARFLISANQGEEPRPVAKIASGGECARIMLAVKSVLSAAENIETMIFDEVDTGISGATSARVGIQLKSLSSEQKQVLCVTHSAQIAALADSHMLISKTVSFGRTETHVRPLTKEGRIKEVARIMGGIDADEAILKAAQKLIEQ